MASPVFFLKSLLYLDALCQFLVLHNFEAFFFTWSSYLFLSFPAGLLPPRFTCKIYFGILLLNILATFPAHFNLVTCLYVTRSVYLYSVYSSSLCRILQVPLTCTGPNIIWRIFLSKEPLICVPLWESFVPMQKSFSDECGNNYPTVMADIFCFKQRH